MDASETSALLQAGIAAAKSGRNEEAREIFLRVIELDDHNEHAWLWMSAVVDSIQDRIVCLENVLTINPESRAAHRGLDQLQSQIPPKAQIEPDPAPLTPDEPAASIVEVDDRPAEAALSPPVERPGTLDVQDPPDRICVHCGTPNPAWRDLCSLCNKIVGMEPVPAPAAPDLPTGEDVQFVPDIDTQPQGLLTLVAAWIAAIAFNKRGAYEYEIFSASMGRTVVGVIVGGVAIPLLGGILTALLFAASNLDNILVFAASVGASTAALACGGLAAAVFLVINFYLWAAGVYVVAWLLGGKASFVVHAQLLSVAYSASTLLILILAIIGGAILSVLGQSASADSPAVALVATAGPLSLAFLGGIYALAIVGQAISVAHRFSWLGGVGTALLSGLLFGLLGITVAMGALALSGLSFAELQTVLTLTPGP